MLMAVDSVKIIVQRDRLDMEADLQ